MAASSTDLRTIAKKRLKAAKILMQAKDWESSAYMLGLSLECALKAAACKTLKLSTYPEYTKKKDIDNFFMTHRFDQLLLVSGMQNVFSVTGPVKSFRNWSDFTVEYPGDWPSMRYDNQRRWDRIKVERLFDNLTARTYGVISEIARRKKW